MEPEFPNLGILGQKASTFKSSKNFACTHVPYFECADFESYICFWKVWKQVSKYEHFGSKLSDLNDVLLVSYDEGAGFKSDIGFRKFWLQMPKFAHFGQNVLTF